MGIGKFMEQGDRMIHLITRFSSRVGALILVGMMLLVTSDVVLRFLFNKPVPGTFELVEVMMGAVVSLSIAYCGLRRGHVSVELLTDHLSRRIQKIASVLHHILCVVFFAAISFKGIQQVGVIKESETVTALLGIPIYPFILILAFGAALLALVYLWQMIGIFRKESSE